MKIWQIYLTRGKEVKKKIQQKTFPTNSTAYEYLFQCRSFLMTRPPSGVKRQKTELSLTYYYTCPYLRATPLIGMAFKNERNKAKNKIK